MTTQEFETLEKEINQARQHAERARGAFDQLMRRLDEEFGCKTINQAKEKLDELKTACERTEKVFAKALEDYQAKWKGGLADSQERE